MPPLPDALAGLLRYAIVADTERAGGSGAKVQRLTMPGGESLFLKSGEGEAVAAIEAEAARLRWLAGRVPTTRVRAYAAEGDCGWLVTEALPGRSAGDWLARDKAAMQWVIAGLSAFLRKLHAQPIEDCPFDSTVAAWLPEAQRRVAEGLVDEDDFDDDHRGWSASAVLAEVEGLADRAREHVVVHGDFTLGNILLDAEGRVTGCIDAGRLGVADRYQDIALCWRDLGGFGVTAQHQFLSAVGGAVPADAARLLLHRCLDELF